MNFKKFSLLAIVNFLLTSAVFCEQMKDIEINRLYFSAFNMGRGDTGIADTDNSEAIFYNPAALAGGKKFFKELMLASVTAQGSIGIQDFLSTLEGSDSTNASAYTEFVGSPTTAAASALSALVFRRAAIGYLASANLKALVYKAPDLGASEVITIQAVVNRTMTYSLAEQFLKDRLQIGTTLKVVDQSYYLLDQLSITDAEDVRDKLEDTMGEFSGYGLDVGMMLVSKHDHPAKLGLTIKDIGNTTLKNKSNDTKRRLYQTVNVGFSLGTGTKFSEMRILVDYYDILSNVTTSTWKKLHIGAHLMYNGMFGITAGLNQGYPTGGFFTDLKFFRADLVYYASEEGSVSGERQDSRVVIRAEVKI